MIVPIDQNYTFIASFGSTRTGKVVKFQVLNSAGVVLCPDAGNWTEEVLIGDANAYVETGSVVELGEGDYGVILNFKTTFSGFVRYYDETDNIKITDPILVSQDWLSDLKRILGLSHENVKITSPVYDTYNNLESATLTVYTDATLTTALASYTITSIGTAMNKFSTWEQVKN